MTPEIRDVFKASVQRHLAKSEKITVSGCYNRCLEDFFSDLVMDPEKGHQVVRLREDRPTLDQFRYWLAKDNNLLALKRKRRSARVYDKDSRGLLGSSRSEVAAPADVGGSLKVATLNVLNYFTTIDDGGNICGGDGAQGCRGADSASELQRQEAKLVEALLGMDADIVGLVEIENAFPEAVETGLTERGHEVQRVGRVAGGMNAIAFEDDGSLTGAACWRADGTPVAIAGGLAREGVRFSGL